MARGRPAQTAGSAEKPRGSLRRPRSVPNDAADRFRPERRLLLAVLSDAIILLRGDRAPSRDLHRREVEATKRWIRSDDRESPCSFVNLCEALGIAHEPLRRHLLLPPVRSGRLVTRRRLLAGKSL